MKKQWLALFVALLLIFTTACGGGGNSQGSSQGASQGSSQETSQGSSDSESSAGDNSGSYNITIAGGSAGGFMSVMTDGYAQIVREALPNTKITVEPGDNATGIMKVMQGQVEVAWSQIAEASGAYNGIEPFPQPLDIRVMFMAYADNPFQFIIEKGFAEKYGIETLADIARVKPPIRMGVNVKGMMTEAIFSDLMKELGFNYDDVKSWGGSIFHTNSKGAAEEMQNQKLDFLAMPVFAPSSEFVALAKHRDLKVIGVGNEDAMNKVAEKWKLSRTTIAKGTYDFVDQDVETFLISGMAVVSPDAPEQMVYDLTKVFFENLDKYRSLHQALQGLTPEKAAASPLPLHPGAEKYMREIGLIQ
jgi:hypothetical protein